jgi:hypothetical protein
MGGRGGLFGFLRFGTNDIFLNVLIESCLCFMGFLRFASK